MNARPLTTNRRMSYQTTSLRVASPSADEKLRNFLTRHKPASGGEIIALTPDASTRNYFRIGWENNATAIAAVYPEAVDGENHPFLDVTRLFTAVGLPVPKILDVAAAEGIIIQEDLGDLQLRCALEDAAEEDERQRYLEQAIGLIAEIQAATGKAYETDSIAGRLAFDEAKLEWELNFFFEHYFHSLLGEKLSDSEERRLKDDLNQVATRLAARPRVLCHRDYHTSNLMVDKQRRLRIVDYQDARMGPASYDLVSLLLDRQLSPPPSRQVSAKRLFFLEERQRYGLEFLDPAEFAAEFYLMSVQRGLKAVGTFSYQTAIAGRAAVYEGFIRPGLMIVLQAAEWLDAFPTLRHLIATHVDDREVVKSE